MLKAAKQSQYKNLVKVQTRSVTTHYVYEPTDINNIKRKDFLDTYASIQHHVGYLKLNREHRYNTLTPNYIKNIRRSLETLNMDELVKVIYMTSAKGEHFSNGTDFRTLLHYKKEGQQEQIVQYLQELYALQIETSKMNKPIIGVAPGHSFNSGAAFIQATAFPTVMPNSQIAFNEVQFGFVPHGGTTFYLSRLPGEIGTFLALTGIPISGVDAIGFKIAENFAHISKHYEEKVADVLFGMDLPILNGNQVTNYGRTDYWAEKLNMRWTQETKENTDNLYERHRKKQEYLVREEFMDPKDKHPHPTAESDWHHKKMLKDYNKRFQNEEGYFDFKKLIYQNYFRYFLDYVKSHSGHEYSIGPKSFTWNTEIINRCFYPNTLEEIMDNLKREDSQFAKLCLERMQQNSQLSMKLALKMIRDAKNLDFKGALKNELNVSLNKIQDKEFDFGVSEVLLKPNRNGQGKNPGFQQEVSDDQVKSYFQPNKWTSQIDLGVVENALLPTRFYYDKFSDQVRLWINEETTPHLEIREYFEDELKTALREQGIDIRDRALTIENARKQLYERELALKHQEEFNQRLTQFSTDSKLRDRYFTQVKEQIDHFENNPQEFYQVVNSKIQKVFEDAYLEKLQLIYDKSKEAQDLDKRRMFIRFKKFLFQSRILVNDYLENERTLNQLQNLPYKLLHMTEKWDGDKSYLEMEHPDIKKSFLWYLSKAIGKRNITPPELARQYLTDPNLPQTMNLFTFDKEELLKLRRDILERPEFYEDMIKSNSGLFSILPDKRVDPQHRKYEEYDYWYRILNEGYLPEDSLPFYKQMIAYRDFVDQIEENAVNSLKMTVSRLIMDFEHQEGVNEIQEFSKNEKESKHQALRRLIGLVNQDAAGQTGKKGKKSQQTSDAKLATKTRSLNDIKVKINSLLEQDPQVSKLLPLENLNAENQLIRKLKNDLLQDLYQLVEFVLLNNVQSKNIPKNLLSERLASLANPTNAEQNNVANLRLIDAFLSEKNSETLIKEAIRIAKPYYFQSIESRLNQEARKVFDAFKSEVTGNEVFFYYMFNQFYPESRHSPVFDKILNFNQNRDRIAYFESLIPDQSNRYMIKKFKSLMGKYEPDQSATLADQEYQIEKQLKEDYATLRQLESVKGEREEQFQNAVIQQRAEHLKTPLEEDKEVGKLPGMTFYNFEPHELFQVVDNIQKADRLNKLIEENQTDLRHKMTSQEWLHIYSNSIKEYGMDMQGAMRVSFPAGMYTGTDFLSEMQKLFGGNKNLTWDDLADYAGFISGILEQQGIASQEKDSLFNYDQVKDYFIKQMDLVDGDQVARNQSIFEMLQSDKYSLNRIGENRKRLLDEIKDFNSLQKRLLDEQRRRQNINILADQAPKNVHSLISQILDSHSEYLNLEELENLLVKKQYEKISAEGVIHKERLLSDVHSGKLLNDFVRNYLDMKLDVVSVAQMKEIASSTQQSNIFDQKLKSQIQILLNFIDDSLKYVPHSRRSEISLGQYLRRHHYLNASSIQDFANEILQNKIKEVLGQEIDIQGADMIDWEYAGIRTNPSTHQEEDELVKDALKQGKGIDPRENVNEFVETQLSPQASNINEDNITGIAYVNPETGKLEVSDKQDYEYEQVVREAKQLTTLRNEFIPYKNFFENEILKVYSSPEFKQESLEQWIKRYTDLRLRDCMLNPDFAKKVKSNNGHIYMKILKEQIADELQLTKPAVPTDFSFATLNEQGNRMDVDVEGRYNLSDLNNLEAIGFDNLEKRAQQQEKNRDLAHQTIFDKLLADYFLQKRGQYVANNELIDQLNKHFDRREYPEGHPVRTKDKFQKNKNIYPSSSDPSFTLQHHIQNIKRTAEAYIKPQNVTAMMELDIVTSQALQNSKNGMSERFRVQLPEEITKIPEYFELFDVRKPPTKHVDDKLTEIIEEIFNVRKKVEKTLTRNELIAYDKILIKYLNKDILIPKLRQECDKDHNILYQLKHGVEMKEEGRFNEEIQGIKSHNGQADANRQTKNEDSLYKFLAYSGMLEKKRREDINKTRKNNEIAFGVATFEEFYKKELQHDAKREPREINPEDFQPKKQRLSEEQVQSGFKTTYEREAEYFKEFELYKENKKEQIERNQLYFVLEQFFAQSKKNPNPLSKAQEAITEYFKDTDNTFFFDKNKIQ